MKQINLPRKPVLTVQLWASLLLIVLAFVFSTTPLITLNNTDNSDEISNVITSLGLGSEVSEYINDVSDISAIELVGSISLTWKIAGAVTTEDEAEKSEKLSEIVEYIDTEKGQNSVGTSVCIAAAVLRATEMGAGGGLVGGLSILISFIALFTILALTLALPVILGITTITSLVTALKNIKTPEEGAPAVANKLPGMAILPLMYILFQNVIPGLSYASGTTAIFILALVSTAISFIATRVREYPDEQFKYLNIVQGCSLLGIIGFSVYFFNMISVGIYRTFITGTYSTFVGLILEMAKAEIEIPSKAFIADGILILVYLFMMIAATDYVDSAIKRLAGATRRNRNATRAKDNSLAAGIVALITLIIPIVLSTLKHGYEAFSTSPEFFSFLELSDAQKGFMIKAGVGIAIMIIADVAVIILKKVFCPTLSPDDAEALLIGTAKTSKEKLEDAKKLVEEAEKQEESAKDSE